MGSKFLNMGTSNQAAAGIRKLLADNGRDYMWLARTTGLKYKPLLAEVKHEKRPLTLDTAEAAAEAFGIDVTDLKQVSA